MNNSSVQPISYEWSSDTTSIMTQEIQPLDIISLSNLNMSSSGSGHIFTSGLGSSGITPGVGISISTGTVTIDTLNSVDFNWKNEEFVDCMPDIHRIKKMCEEYPGLKIAYEKFVTTYKLVKDHYDTPEDQRPRP